MEVGGGGGGRRRDLLSFLRAQEELEAKKWKQKEPFFSCVCARSGEEGKKNGRHFLAFRDQISELQETIS